MVETSANFSKKSKSSSSSSSSKSNSFELEVPKAPFSQVQAPKKEEVPSLPVYQPPVTVVKTSANFSKNSKSSSSSESSKSNGFAVEVPQENIPQVATPKKEEAPSIPTYQPPLVQPSSIFSKSSKKSKSSESSKSNKSHSSARSNKKNSDSDSSSSSAIESDLKRLAFDFDDSRGPDVISGPNIDYDTSSISEESF